MTASVYDGKSPHVSWTLHSILADLNNTVVWMLAISLPISNFSDSISIPFETFPSAPITNSISVTLVFFSFLRPQARSKYLYVFLPPLIFSLWSGGMAKSTVSRFCFLFSLFFYHLVQSSGWLIITVTLMFHSFFNSLVSSKDLYFFSFSFISTMWSAGTAMSTIQLILFFFFYFKAWLSGRG